MHVTFDSQNWQPVVRPDKHQKDPRHSDFVKINDALKDGRIKGFIVDTVATPEGIPRVDCGKYFAGQSGGHPGLVTILRERLEDAHKLGFQLLHALRIGIDVPNGLEEFYLPDANDQDRVARQARAFAAGRLIESQAVGKTYIEAIGKRIALRRKLTGPWYKFLGSPADDKENEEIADAVGEWADEDAVAAHEGYQLDFFCSDDMGKSGSKALGDSILTPANRAWLSASYGVKFLTLKELAAKL